MLDVVGYAKENIPEKLTMKFKEQFEEYDWMVLVNPESRRKF
jgi:hypothetical protein